MDRFVVMVDAGYLLRQAIEIISNKVSTERVDLDIADPSGLIEVLLDKARATLALNGKELLRVYWYDGVMTSGLTPQQQPLVNLDDVQFRAGTINGRGQQKGVDSLIVTDLIELTSHHAISDAVLVTGDSDLGVGIEMVQKRGIRVAVLGVEDLAAGVFHNQSFEITSRADRVGMLGQEELARVLRYVPTQPAAAQQPTVPVAATEPVPSSPAAEPIDRQRIENTVKAFVAQQTATLAGAVDCLTKRISADVDSALLYRVLTELGHGRLTEDEKVYARHVFRAQV
jgi:uncharacterized LabA/DUF88 family protein